MSASPLKILLLEDNPGDAGLLQAAVSEAAPGKFAITQAQRLGDALALVRSKRFDLVLCDLALPDSTGLATIDAIVVEAGEIPLVVLTGSHDEDVGSEAIVRGAQDYLVKGESSGALVVRTLRYAIERKRLEIDLQQAKARLERRIAERTAELGETDHALRESEARFRRLTEMSSDFYWESDAEHRLKARGAGDRKLSQVAVFQRGGQFGKRRWEIPHLSPDEAGWRAHRVTLDARLPFRNFEFSRLGTDGSERFMSISGDPVFDSWGAFIGYQGVGSDITESKRAERKLAESEEQFRGLVEQSNAGILIIQDGKFAYANPRLCEIYGYASQDELLKVDPLSLVAEEDRPATMEVMRRLSDGAEARISHTMTARRKDGSRVEIGASSSRSNYRDRPAIIGIVQDISERSRTQEQIKNYVAQLEKAVMSTVEVATTLGEMRDPYTAGHQRRVAEIAVAIGAKLDFDAARQEGLRVAGYLHDIGKITIPAEILTKPGKLSRVEYRLIRGHPQSGYDVLKKVSFPWPVAEVALQHHERMDGSGYPQGLKGEEILMESRIMAVADVVEAMSSHRPYRPGLGMDKALAEIEHGRGTTYDAEVVEACLRVFREQH